MIVSVTPLGDSSGAMSSVQVAAKIAEYLDGVGLAKAGQRAGQRIELPSLTGEGTVAYYADSTGIRPGQWVGSQTGDVDSATLVALLAGVDRETGEALESAITSSRGRKHTADRQALSGDQEWFSTKQASGAIGVRHTYLQRLAKSASDDLVVEAAGESLPRRSGVRNVVLEAMRSGSIAKKSGNLVFHSEALEAIAEARRPQTNVVAYDVTFSVPKDVSVIWARGDDEVRANILTAIDTAVQSGLAYLERNAIQVRVGGEQAIARNWLGADYLHLTSRALEPQLHHHVVLINRAEDGEGNVRALDGRLLFAHAKTAGYVAAAELRHQLAARLGIQHGAPVRGIAPIAGMDRAVLDEFSTRSREINEVAQSLGVHSATARQVAAYDTRSAKEAGFDFDEVTQWWSERMEALGFDADALESVLHRIEGPGVLSPADIDLAFAALVDVAGITENEARFDRRLVVQALAEYAGDRLSGEAVENLADRFLSLDYVVQLDLSRDTSRRNVIRLANGRAVSIPLEGSYTTRNMLNAERRAMALYSEGRDANCGVVPKDVLGATLADPRFARLSDEQRTFVTEFTTSGHRVQGAVGIAGSGKTTALEAVVAAWRAAGYNVLGASVGGTQAVTLAEEATGDALTVASVIARYFDAGDHRLITNKTVLLVDEASLLSTVDVASLERAVVENAGAILRLVGDQEQHTSVAAGGFFRWLVEMHSDDVPELRTNYRQQGDEQAEVRLALDEYREGMITEAMERLNADGRIVEADSFEEACDLLTCSWYAERSRRANDPSRRISSMTADHHYERLELNTRARAMLQADGTLTGPTLEVDGIGFQVNDEVIAKVGDHHLRANGALRDQWVRNGSRGVVREVAPTHLVVGFERWGDVTIPLKYIEQEVVPGIRGGLMHSYALTTHAAQGATMAAAMPLLTDASSREGAYVGLTRHQFHLNAVAIRYDKIVERVVDDPLPILRSELSDLEATSRSLANSDPERLATQLDPEALAVNTLASTHSLRQLVDAEVSSEDQHRYDRAIQERIRALSLCAVTNPPPDIAARLGSRPLGREDRASWDAAVGAIAVYRELTGARSVADGHGVEWALGPRPIDDAAAAEYDAFATQIAGAPLRTTGSDADSILAGSRYLRLSDADVLEFFADTRAAASEQGHLLDRLGRNLELQLDLIHKAENEGRDVAAMQREFDASELRYDEKDESYSASVEELQQLEAELVRRGLEVVEADRPFVGVADTPVADSDEIAHATIERAGPELEI